MGEMLDKTDFSLKYFGGGSVADLIENADENSLFGKLRKVRDLQF
jgi:hypothetical protein